MDLLQYDNLPDCLCATGPVTKIVEWLKIIDYWQKYK